MESSRSIVARRAAALLVILVAGALIALEAQPLVDLFSRSDPRLSGSFSLLNARPLLSVAAHAALILIGMHRLLAPPSTTVSSRARARLCYGVFAIELLALTPCVFGRAALCGVFYVGLGPVTATLILIGFAAYLATSRSRALITATGLTVISIAGSALTTFWYVTPRSHHECARLAEPIRRDLCRMNFALRMDDAALCDTIDFDPSRWSCTYQIAERKGEPELCDRIAPPCRHRSPGLVCDPDFYRNTCFLVVARKLRDPRLCEQMTPGELQARCLKQTR